MTTLNERPRRSRLAVLAAPLLAAGFALLCLGATDASAATVECKGKIERKGSSVKKYEYDIKCSDAGGVEDHPTQIDAYTIVSTKAVAGFHTEVVVTSGGETVDGESFACEGPIPSFGFGCFGKASLEHWIEGEFTLTANPCSRSARKAPWRAWAVAAADKINPITFAHTKATSEPFPLRVPRCAPLG